MSSVKSYTIPAHPRPGKRCALAKRDLGDDLLTVVAVVPIGPWDFSQRQYLRKYLLAPAHAVRSRQFHRKIYSSSSPKRHPSFSTYMDRQHKLAGLKAYKHINYTSYEWGWNLVKMTDPVDDPRAVCVEVVFAVSNLDPTAHSFFPVMISFPYAFMNNKRLRSFKTFVIAYLSGGHGKRIQFRIKKSQLAAFSDGGTQAQ